VTLPSGGHRHRVRAVPTRPSPPISTRSRPHPRRKRKTAPPWAKATAG